MSVEDEKNTSHPRLRKPATRDHLLKRSRPRRVVPVVIDEDAHREYEDASDAYTILKAQELPETDPELMAARERYEAAEEALNEATVEMVFEAIGRRDYENLLMEHPPSTEQEKQAKEAGEKVDYNIDTFPPALVAATCIEPKFSEEEAYELFEQSTGPECMVFFTAAMAVCGTTRVGDLGKGFGRMLG